MNYLALNQFVNCRSATVPCALDIDGKTLQFTSVRTDVISNDFMMTSILVWFMNQLRTDYKVDAVTKLLQFKSARADVLGSFNSCPCTDF